MAGKVAKVPQVMQMEALECGAACLTMVLAYYGKWVPLEQVRADCGVSRDGSKASNIVKAARSYGLSARGFTMSTEALRKKDGFPYIIFWNFNHFVVLDGFRGNNAIINDPGRGQVKVPLSEFEDSFTGIVLAFEKTDEFEEGGVKPDTIAFARRRLDGLGAAIAFVMLTAVITSIAGIANTALGQVFLDRILSGNDPDWLMPLVAIMLALAVVTGVVTVLNAVYFARIQGRIAVVSSSRFMRHLLHLPVGFYAQRMVGDLQQRQSANETIAFSLIGQLAPVLVNGAMLILYLIIMLQYSVLLTVVGLLTVALNVAMARYISAKRVNLSRSSAMANGKLYSTTVGGIEMMETIKASGAENGFFGRWAGYQAAVNEASVRTTRLNEYLGMVPAILSQLANIVVLVLGIWLIVEGAFTPGALLAFTGFLSSFMAPVSQMIDLGQTVQELATEMERVEDVLRYPVDVPEDASDAGSAAGVGAVEIAGAAGPAGVELAGAAETAGADEAAGAELAGAAEPAGAEAAGAELAGAAEFALEGEAEVQDDGLDALSALLAAMPAGREKLRGQVDLTGVTFGYSPLEAPLIEDFSLHLEPGKWVALVGGSGCGKSTIAKLVAGLYEPWTGEVRFDGMPIKEVPRPVLRGSLAVVDQDVVVFDGTVSENVKLWDHSIEDYEVIMACRDAGIHDVIVAREGGYSSLILPGGRNFSGGQLQRLEIARVLAQDPTVIILDEATSALDAQTEADVIRRIREREITCIVVAHRLSTIRDCDEIIVLDDGKVVERGTHDELLAKDGAYAELVRSD